MAMKTHSYFKNYKRTTLIYFTLIQILSALLASGVAILVWQFLNSVPANAFIICLVVLIIVNIIFSFVLFNVASKPFKILTGAVAHVSKDPVITAPPHVDTARYERSGLKDLVQTIYELAAQPESKKTQTQIGQSGAEFFKELTDNLPCGLIAVARDGSIIYANNLAPTKGAPDGRLVSTLLFEQNDNLENWLTDSETNKVRDTHSWQRIADKLPGEPDRRIYDVISFYQKDNPGGVAAIVVAVDRTNVYSADQEDMDFIALAAHELRGPITVIRGYLDVIKHDLATKLTPDDQELLDRLQVSSERLAGYINNILNVSRYDRKQFQVHINEENLTEIIKGILPDLALRARTQKRKLLFKIPSNLPTIAADRTSLGEVITNLVDNAIKYSHPGGEVVISATVKDPEMVEVTVQDFGIGMPESVVGGLFNKFYRSHRSRGSIGGTGLGLYICKAMIESHGGSIWVRSHEGEGSTFGFTVPTYAAVATRLQSGDNQVKDIIQRPEGWIKNHAMYRR